MVMRFEGLDLNLLVAFNALLEERSVSKAAERLHTSQPAMSAALNKLREYFHDPLLIRSGREMVPTSQAEYLMRPIAEVLSAIKQAMNTKPAFLPGEANRVFRITMSDYMASVLLPGLLVILRRDAPGIKIEMVTSDQNQMTRLERGETDIIITPEKFLNSEHPSVLLTEDSFVVVVDQHNKAVGATISLEQYLEMDHVVVNLSTDRTASFEDWFLGHFNIRRRHVLSVPLFSLVPSLIVNTTLIATMHVLLAKQLARNFAIRLVPVPKDFPTLREHLQWHTLRDHDLGLAWLRQQLIQIAREEGADRPAPQRAAAPIVKRTF